MKFVTKHWFDIGAGLTVLVLIYLYQAKDLTNYDYVMWLSLVSLFLHQLEEYKLVGTFPGMLNRVMFKSDIPDRYPLNALTSVYVNVLVGWLSYFFAAIFGQQAIWLGIATMLVSLGNTVAHSTVFNIKGKTYYNAGMATSWLLFAPCIYFFFITIHTEHLVTLTDYIIGVPVGIFLNVIGIIKLIDWFADKDTKYVFEQKNLLPIDRQKNYNR
ncbi:MAG: HXXEE domain-containing protein [Cytophagaceae bacterium]|jgi:hypothetical protein|nr:HXXEE domain-containing protein [Cytophagaceae bacterium]